MSVRSGIVIASCLTLSLAAAGAALAAPPAQSDGSRGSLQAVRFGASADWFPISFEPARASGTDLLKPVDELVRSQTSSAPASQSQQEVQVPATVQNLRRADH